MLRLTWTTLVTYRGFNASNSPANDGKLVASEAQERQMPAEAINAARVMASTAAGAVAFSRSGDLNIGEFEDAVVIKQFSEVPWMICKNVSLPSALENDR